MALSKKAAKEKKEFEKALNEKKDFGKLKNETKLKPCKTCSQTLQYLHRNPKDCFMVADLFRGRSYCKWQCWNYIPYSNFWIRVFEVPLELFDINPILLTVFFATLYIYILSNISIATLDIFLEFPCFLD